MKQIARLTTGFLAAGLLLGTSPMQSAEQPGSQPPSTGPALGDPDVERIIEDLEREAARRSRPIRPEPVSTRGLDPSSRPAKLLREGTFIVSRRGRMIRSGTGDWIFAQDNDTDSASEPPMVLMPCMALMAMESIAQRQGEATTFTVSGQVFLYHNRNHLLPTLYVVNRPSSNLKSSQ